MTTLDRVLQPVRANSGFNSRQHFPVLKAQLTESEPKRRSLGQSSKEEEGMWEGKRARLDTHNQHFQNSASEAAVSGRPPNTSAPSDFAGLNSHIRQSSMLQGGPHVVTQQITQPAQPALPTFLDITSGRTQSSTGTDAVQKHHYHQSLRNMLNAGRENSSSVDAAATAPTAAPAAAPGLELPVQVMPYDWVLKRSARFLMSAPQLAACEQALRLDPRLVGQAQEAFLKGEGFEGLPPEAKLHASLLSWQFPDSSWDSDTIKVLVAAVPPSVASSAANPAGGPTAGGQSFGLGTSAAGSATEGIGARDLRGGVGSILGARLSAWRGSLRSVYTQLRAGNCPAFYMVAQGSRPFAILFCAQGVRGCNHWPHALVSQSTRALRGKLTAAGVQFTMPLAPLHNDERIVLQAIQQRRVEVDDELVALAEDAAPADAAAGVPSKVAWTSARDHSPESLLLLLGPQAVHGLFDLLLNEVHFQEQQLLGREPGDLPLLLAPTAFEGATLQRPCMKVRAGAEAGAARQLPRQASSSSMQPFHADDPQRNGSGMANSCAMELSGPLPPWVVHRSLHVLRETEQGHLQVQLDSETMCLGLNVGCSQSHPGTGIDSADVRQASCGGGVAGAWSSAEAAAAKDANMAFQKRVIKGVSCQPGGSLVLRLS